MDQQIYHHYTTALVEGGSSSALAMNWWQPVSDIHSLRLYVYMLLALWPMILGI